MVGGDWYIERAFRLIEYHTEMILRHRYDKHNLATPFSMVICSCIHLHSQP